SLDQLSARKARGPSGRARRSGRWCGSHRALPRAHAQRGSLPRRARRQSRFWKGGRTRPAPALNPWRSSGLFPWLLLFFCSLLVTTNYNHIESDLVKRYFLLFLLDSNMSPLPFRPFRTSRDFVTAGVWRFRLPSLLKNCVPVDWTIILRMSKLVVS